MEETFVQAPLPATDLLFVIDNTASMAQEQAALAGAFQGMADALDELGVSWQLGTTTVTWPEGERGWLRGTPFVVAGSSEGVGEAVDQAVSVGTNGVGAEAGLAAAISALDESIDGANQGFRRDGASLQVIFVSDGDDASDGFLPSPVEDFLERLAAEEQRTGQRAVASAIVGPEPSGCTSGSGTAQPGSRYLTVATESGGIAGDICAADFGPILDAVSDASVEWPRRFALANTPVEGSLRAFVDGVAVEPELELDPPAVWFDVAPNAGSLVRVQYLVLAK